MIGALAEEPEAADANEAVHVIVIAAAGRIFSAGHDLSESRGIPDRAGLEAGDSIAQ